jgi:hypothetical protein
MIRTGSGTDYTLYVGQNSAQFVKTIFSSQNGDSTLTLSQGNVGIGTTNPLYTLDVNGSLRVGATTVFNGVTYNWPSTAMTNGYLQNTATGLTWVTVSGVGATSVPFAGVTAGTNLSQVLTVGNGSILNYAGSGTINATNLLGGNWDAPGAIGGVIASTGVFTTLTGNTGRFTIVGIGYTGPYGVGTSLAVSGNVGIGTTSPLQALDVNQGYVRAQRFVDTQDVNYYLDPAGTSIINSLNVTGASGIGLGLGGTGAYIKESGGMLQVYGSIGAGGTDNPSLCVGPNCEEKIDAGAIDPPYTINGKKYATYMSSMTGMKEETTGSVETNERIDGVGYRTIVDFTKQPEASDLWLFSKTTNLKENIDKMVILLTPEKNTRTWYSVDPVKQTLSIFSSRPTKISYRLTAPRFDYLAWKNTRNSAHSGYVLNNPDQPNTDSEYVYDGNLNNDEEIGTFGEITANILNVSRSTLQVMSTITANIENATINTMSSITASIKTLTSETISTVSLNAQNLTSKIIHVDEKITSPIVETQDIIATGESKLAQIDTNVIKPQEQNLTIDLNNKIATDEPSGPLASVIIKGLAGKTVASIDAGGNASFSGSLTAKDASISGTLAAEEIQSSKIKSQNYEGQEATLSGKLVAKTVEAENIKAIEDRLDVLASGTAPNNDELTMQINDIQKLLADIKNQPLSNPQYYQQIDQSINTGVTNPQPPFAEATEGGSANPQSGNLSIDQLTVTGNSNLYNVSVSGSLLVGNLFIENNSIISLASELKFSALEKITLFDGSVVIAKDGTITTQGSLIAMGGVKTNEISPVNEGDDVNIKLKSPTFAEATAGKQNSKLNITDELGNIQASIDASGSAKFKQLALDKYLDATSSAAVIAAAKNYVKNGIDAPAIETQTETAGVGILPSNEIEIVIYNDNIKDGSLIYLTPTENIPNNQLTVTNKISCHSELVEGSSTSCKPYFKVSTGTSSHGEIRFNWLIIN